MIRRFLITWGICVALGGLAGSHALAAQLPVTSASPADGVTLTPGGGIPFKVASPMGHLSNMYVAVASQDALDPEGALATGVSLDRFRLSENTANPGTFEGSSPFPPANQGWSFTPGTYYWQASAIYTEASGVKLQPHQEFSPVFTLVLAPPASALPGVESTPPAPAAQSPQPSPTLTLPESERQVRRIIKQKTGRSAHRLHNTCVQTSLATVTCKAAWLTAWPPQVETTRFIGTFHLQARTGGLRYSFVGLREQLGCTRRQRANRCASRLQW
jgi:hypothetical protein